MHSFLWNTQFTGNSVLFCFPDCCQLWHLLAKTDQNIFHIQPRTLHQICLFSAVLIQSILCFFVFSAQKVKRRSATDRLRKCTVGDRLFWSADESPELAFTSRDLNDLSYIRQGILYLSVWVFIKPVCLQKWNYTWGKEGTVRGVSLLAFLLPAVPVAKEAP